MLLKLNVTTHHAALLQIALVVLLSLPKCLRRLYLGGNRLAIGAGGVKFGDLRSSLGCLLLVVSEDNAAILRSPIRALSVHLGRIVKCKKCVEKCLIREAGRVKLNLYDFRVAGAVATDFLIGWVFEVSAFVSYCCVNNACEFAKTGLYSPTT